MLREGEGYFLKFFKSFEVGKPRKAERAYLGNLRQWQRGCFHPVPGVHPKAPSPLRSAGAVHIGFLRGVAAPCRAGLGKEEAERNRKIILAFLMGAVFTGIPMVIKVPQTLDEREVVLKKAVFGKSVSSVP